MKAISMTISEEEAKIVLERLRIMPRTIKLNIGMYGSFTKEELIKEISDKTKIGDMVIQMQMSYLRSFKERVK